MLMEVIIIWLMSKQMLNSCNAVTNYCGLSRCYTDTYFFLLFEPLHDLSSAAVNQTHCVTATSRHNASISCYTNTHVHAALLASFNTNLS